MDLITTVLIFLLAVVVSGPLAHALPAHIPIPLVQIAVGAVLASVTDLRVDMQPEIFFLLFLPPLLFLDGWRIPKDGLLRDRRTILALAFGLVVFTVVGAGVFVHWMIPAMPLGVAFALAAIVSPTDPVAVSAIAARTPIPHRLMHILEGESLLNDASGLVCMRFAVAAVLTGAFSPVDAFGVFLWLALGGLTVGVAVTLGVLWTKRWVAHRVGEETGSEILISLLIPFGAYLLAERLECSGILAAVSAALTMSYVEQSGRALALTRVRRAGFWDTVQFAANGTIFVLLGEQLPNIVAGAAEVVRKTGHLDPLWLLVYIAGTNAALASLRLVWVWVSFHLTLRRDARAGAEVQKPSWRLIAATTLAGTRGAVTLAGVLTLPLTLIDGSAFPARDLAVFLAAGTIILSLIAASVGLPLLLDSVELPPEPTDQEEENRARVAAAEAAMKAVARARRDAPHDSAGDANIVSDASGRVMEIYRRRIELGSKTGEEAETVRSVDRIERELRLAAIRAERDTLFDLARRRLLPDETTRRLVRELDLIEARFAPG